MKLVKREWNDELDKPYVGKQAIKIGFASEPESEPEETLKPFYVTVRASQVYEVLAVDHEDAEDIVFDYRVDHAAEYDIDEVDVEAAFPGLTDAETTHFLRREPQED